MNTNTQNKQRTVDGPKWGPGMFFETEEEYLQDEQRRSNQTEVGFKKVEAFELTSLRDLLAEPEEETDWVVEGLLPVGGFSLVAAKPKVGKSTIARQLALCVARGEDFLDREATQGLVVYLALEERRSDVRTHFKQMGATGDENLKIFAGMAPADAISQMRKMALQENPSLIVVDTLARIAKIRDLNDYAQTTSGLEPLLAIARETGSHVCLLHHARKGDGKGIDSILGSTGIAGSVDTILTLHKTTQYRTMASIQRVGIDIKETVLNFDSERRWSDLGDYRKDAEIERAKEGILEFLSNQGEPVEEKIIDKGVEINRSCRKKALRKLVDEKKIERLGEGKKGHPYLYTVSGLMVPPICTEPENQNTKISLINGIQKSNSGSQDDSALQIVLPGSEAISLVAKNNMEV